MSNDNQFEKDKEEFLSRHILNKNLDHWSFSKGCNWARSYTLKEMQEINKELVEALEHPQLSDIHHDTCDKMLIEELSCNCNVSLARQALKKYEERINV